MVPAVREAAEVEATVDLEVSVVSAAVQSRASLELGRLAVVRRTL